MAVHLGDLELALELALVVVLQGEPDEGVDADELELQVVRLEGGPLAVLELLDVDGEHDVVLDGVGNGGGRLLAHVVVVHGDDLEDAGLLEAPVGQGRRQRPVAARGALLSRGVDAGGEELVREEVEGAGEDDPGVVPGLQPGDEDGVLAGGVRVVLDGLVGVVAVGRRRRGQDLQDERVLAVGDEAAAAVQDGVDRPLADDVPGLDEVRGVGDDERVPPLVLGVEVVVVDDGGALLVRFETVLGGDR